METNKVISQVVMLPTTDQKAPIIRNTYRFNPEHGNPLIALSQAPILSANRKSLEDRGYKFNHLYFTVDGKKINVGNLYIVNHMIKRCVSVEHNKHYKYFVDENGNEDIDTFCKKIIGTTDENLRLEIIESQHKTHEGGFNLNSKEKYPKPTQAFVEAYCEAGGINEVEIEYHRVGGIGMAGSFKTLTIKVNNYNEMTIRPVDKFNFLDDVEFFDMMQAYRMALPTDQSEVVKKFENVKKFIKEKLR